jgi:hypothetical protein
MIPKFFHIIPTTHNTITDWILKVKDTSFGLSLITEIKFSMMHTHQFYFIGCSNYSRDTASGIFITSKASFGLARSVINNNCRLRHINFKNPISLLNNYKNFAIFFLIKQYMKSRLGKKFI